MLNFSNLFQGEYDIKLRLSEGIQFEYLYKLYPVPVDRFYWDIKQGDTQNDRCCTDGNIQEKLLCTFYKSIRIQMTWFFSSLQQFKTLDKITHHDISEMIVEYLWVLQTPLKVR